MPIIKQESIEELKSIIDIVEVIGNYVDVKRQGSAFVALCPFHDDKNPSMSISLNKGLYHCHACGAGGDSIKFVMNIEGLDFAQAVEKIAIMFNFHLSYDNNYIKKEKSDVLPLMANFYHANLLKNKHILQYLYRRGLKDDIIKEFKIGYCGASFETLKFLDSNKIPTLEAIKYGILMQNADRFYAKFSNRIIFPIFAANDSVIGFGGRILQSENNVAKYINSSNNEVFNKSKILYGFNIARNFIHKQKSMIITEGYLDVIMLHQNGFKNATATLGTAFNEGHLGILKKLDSKIFMCYDGDNAGLKAALSASILLAQNNKDGGVIILPQNLDPADMMQKNLVDEFKNLLNNHISFVEFVIMQIAKTFDLNNVVQKQQALKKITDFMNTLDPFLQNSYIDKIVSILNIDKRLIKLKRNKKHIDIKLEYKSNDSAEERVLVSMLENDDNFFQVLGYLDSRHFDFYKKEFEMIKNNDIDNDLINAFRFKTNEMPLDLENLKNQIRLILLKYAKNILKNIINNNIAQDEKILEIKRLKDIITSLSNGQLVQV